MTYLTNILNAQETFDTEAKRIIDQLGTDIGTCLDAYRAENETEPFDYGIVDHVWEAHDFYFGDEGLLGIQSNEAVPQSIYQYAHEQYENGGYSERIYAAFDDVKARDRANYDSDQRRRKYA